MGSPTQGFIELEIIKGSVQPSFTFPKDFSFLSVAIPFPDAFFRTTGCYLVFPRGAVVLSSSVRYWVKGVGYRKLTSIAEARPLA